MPDQPKNALEQLFGYLPIPKATQNPALQNGGLGLALPVRPGVPDLPSKGCLKVQAYVHNRLTICAYQGGSRVVAKRMKARDVKGLLGGTPNIYLLRKTRQTLKVGGRWREKPLETDFTSRAKNWVRDSCHLIETETGGVPLFLTLTCPGDTDRVFEAFGIASGYIVDRFNRWLRYRVKEGWYAYVWELQKRGAPHLHYLFKIEAGSNFQNFYKEVRQEWRKILLDVSAESGVDLFRCADDSTHRDNPNLPVIHFRKVKTSVSGYLAKYASKGRSKGVRGIHFSPGRWWGVSYPLRREVNLRRVSYVLGMTQIEMATSRLIECVERLGSVVTKIWRCNAEKTGPGDFVSLLLGGVAPAVCARALSAWLVDGDLTELEKICVIPPMVQPAPS